MLTVPVASIMVMVPEVMLESVILVLVQELRPTLELLMIATEIVLPDLLTLITLVQEETAAAMDLTIAAADLMIVLHEQLRAVLPEVEVIILTLTPEVVQIAEATTDLTVLPTRALTAVAVVVAADLQEALIAVVAVADLQEASTEAAAVAAAANLQEDLEETKKTVFS